MNLWLPIAIILFFLGAWPISFLFIGYGIGKSVQKYLNNKQNTQSEIQQLSKRIEELEKEQPKW